MSSRSQAWTMWYTARKPSVFLCGVLGLIAVSGCAPHRVRNQPLVPLNQVQRMVREKPARLRPMYARVLQEGQRNLGLNHMRVGLAAFELGHYDLAENALDQALAGIEAVYANVAQHTGVPLIPFLLEGIAEQPSFFQSDGIHPSAEAQPIILDNVWTALVPLL